MYFLKTFCSICLLFVSFVNLTESADSRKTEQNDMDVSSCFKRFENKIIIGFARKTLNASSADDCLRHCLTSWFQFKFVCASVTFYKNVQGENENCIINSESRFTQEKTFTTQPASDNVVYFDNLCAPTELPGTDLKTLAIANFTDVKSQSSIGYVKVVQNPNDVGAKNATTVFGLLYPGATYRLQISSKTSCTDGIGDSDLVDFMNVTADKFGVLIGPMSKVSTKENEKYLNDLNHAVLLFGPKSNKDPLACAVLSSSDRIVFMNIFAIICLAFVTICYYGI